MGRDDSGCDISPSTLPMLELSYQKVITRTLFYPENDAARRLIEFGRRKALTKDEVKQLREFGFPITIWQRDVDLLSGML